MSNRTDPRYPHLLVGGTAIPNDYTYPRPVRPKLNVPPRDRATHAAALIDQLHVARVAHDSLDQQRRALGVGTERGMCIEFESEPGFDLALQSLDRDRGKIELVAVRQTTDRIFATVLVPEGGLGQLFTLVEDYATKDDPRYGKPKNRRLVETVSYLRHAALEAFWTDDVALLPSPGQAAWWEVWLRGGDDPDAIRTDFVSHAQKLGLRVGDQWLSFPDRSIGLAFGSREQMAASVELLDCIAELRLAKESAGFFTSKSCDRREWVDSYRLLMTPPPADAPAVCVLDTGVNRGHPLLWDLLDENDMLTCDPEWGKHDHRGHGTEMAGLAAHGDLTEALTRTNPLVLEHRLESVKVSAPEHLAPDADLVAGDARKHLYGVLTRDSSSLIESVQPFRSRSYCMAISTDDGRDRGAPSSWSAEVDRLCFGDDDSTRRLFVLAAGNVARENWCSYPAGNDTDAIHDPGQAWNALTVGAHTDKWRLESGTHTGWTPVARPGTLAPSSTTSHVWESRWPNKPDFVLEGGNGARDGAGFVDAPDDLSLLTTYYRPDSKLLAAFGDTSAAAAQAARMSAILMARYPTFWPETIRGLLVHSAEWTPAMQEEARQEQGHRDDFLLRRYGYGVPDLDRASWSASNALTLVAQDVVTPYGKTDGKVGTRDWSLHTLPWPRAQLEELFQTEVELRVTLSYYVEPNPARRGWKYRHRYASHGLRFAIRNPGESMDEFQARVSKDAQSEESGKPSFSEPGWRLGRKRDRGSIHSDRWFGTAAELADRNHVAVFPVGGWWKERAHLGRWQHSVRYSLIVSIRTPATKVDIYTPIAVQVGVQTAVSVE